MRFISKKRKSVNKDKITEEFASEIVEIFEEKLEELNIILPDKFRESKENEARIFGSNYYDLCDRITEFIRINRKKLTWKERGKKYGSEFARIYER